MKKSIIKYFSLFLILILINSNFSFALTQMMCKMSEVQTECECSPEIHSGILTISSDSKGCCDINVSELNNSNTLEKNNNKSIQDITQQAVMCFIPVTDITKNLYNHFQLVNCNIPVPDIPIINSSLLI